MLRGNKEYIKLLEEFPEFTVEIASAAYYGKNSSLITKQGYTYSIRSKETNRQLVYFTIRPDFNCGLYRIENYVFETDTNINCLKGNLKPKLIILLNGILDLIHRRRQDSNGYQLYTFNNNEKGIILNFLRYTNFKVIGNYANPNYSTDKDRMFLVREHCTHAFEAASESNF